MKRFIAVVLLLLGAVFVWLSFVISYDANFTLLAIGIIFSFFGYKIWKKKKTNFSNSNASYQSAKENPKLTRFGKKYCDQCNKMTPHETARISDGSPKAYVTCISCGRWKEEPW